MFNQRAFSKIITIVLIAVCMCLVGTPQAMAQSTHTQGCHHVHGTLTTQVVSAGLTQGTVTQRGRLKGTTQDQISSFNASAGTYTATFQDMTKHGTLITNDTGQSFSNGTFVENGTVDGAASTGRFAGATGSISFNGSSTDGVHFTAHITGKICGINP